MIQAVEPSDTSADDVSVWALYEALADLLHVARFTVPGVAHVGLTLAGDALDAPGITLVGARTVVATGPTARTVDEAQYEFGDGPCLHAMRSQTTCEIASVATDERWPPVLDVAVRAGIGSSLSVPILVDGQVRGAVNVYAEQPDAFSGPVRQAIDAVARPMALIIRELRLLQTARSERDSAQQAAKELQRRLLPTLPELPGIELAARYRASGAGDVGGDWYDAFGLDDGVLGLVIGDVMGHDLTAAAAMGQVCGVLRSYAFEGHFPSQVLGSLDRLVQHFDLAPFATVVYGRLTVDQGSGMFLWANAGHPPPLLRLRDGTVRLLQHDQPAVAIGVAPPEPRTWTEKAVEVPPGSTLLLYTDGLVEQRRRDLDEGIDALADLLAGAPSERPGDLCDHVLGALNGRRNEDDIALLAVRLP